ncbi:uncharacterized protein ACO6RY_07022 [Pungitius sinensis]
MLLSFSLLMFLCESKVKSLSTTTWPKNDTSTKIHFSSPPAVEVSEHFGISALVCSLLALITIFAVIFWLAWHRLHGTLITGDIAAKGFPGSEQPPKEGWPQIDTEGDREVYINYTSTCRNYTDLNPTTVIEDNVYSSLS